MFKHFLINVLILLYFVEAEHSEKKVFCYYDANNLQREVQARLLTDDLDPAMSFCTHLIYGYAGIASNDLTISTLNHRLEIYNGSGNYTKITNLKHKYPGLKVLLSVGGGADKEDSGKYLRLLESTVARNVFVDSTKNMLKDHGFDGVDLAWQFPPMIPKMIRSPLHSFWHGFKKKFNMKKVADKNFGEYKEKFTNLVKEMKEAFEKEKFILIASVLPNVNTSDYFDLYSMKKHLDYIILHAYDYNTPDRNPVEADFSSPLYKLFDKNPKWNINYLITYWISHDFPAEKIILGLATFGRAWKMTSKSAIRGMPPITVDGAADEGPYTKTKGLLSYSEICMNYGDGDNTEADPHHYLRRIPYRNKKEGTYAYRLPDKTGNKGIWVSYDDPESILYKIEFATLTNLAGIALVDLSLDDFKGSCHDQKYPLLKAAADILTS